MLAGASKTAPNLPHVAEFRLDSPNSDKSIIDIIADSHLSQRSEKSYQPGQPRIKHPAERGPHETDVDCLLGYYWEKKLRRFLGETQRIEYIESYVDIGSLMEVNGERRPPCEEQLFGRGSDRSLQASSERSARQTSRRSRAVERSGAC